jgi:geranylgeranyl pyrophosphate synthase
MTTLARALDNVRDLLTAAVPTSSPAGRQLRAHGFGAGKLLRPQFTITIALDLGCEEHHDVLAAAAAAELLHEASLIHDDILDEASTRRGRPTVRRTYGNPSAILLGDKLLAAANRVIATIHHADIRRLLTYTTETTVRAALIQHGGVYASPATPRQYLRCIAGLTAAAFRAGAAIPAIITGLSPNRRHALACHGLAFGTAYQLFDDAADLAEDLLVDRVTYVTLVMRHQALTARGAFDQTSALARAYLARALHPPLPLAAHESWLAQALGEPQAVRQPHPAILTSAQTPGYQATA